MTDEQAKEHDDHSLTIAIANVLSTPAGRADILANRAVTYGDDKAVTNFKGDKRQRWQFMARCLGPECIDGKTMLGQSILLKHYYVTAIDQENEATGEREPAIYVVLWDGISEPVSFWSPYVARDLARMIQSLGTDDFGDGIPVKVVESTKPGKRAFYGLLPA
jgi:hypothetical protein